MTALSNMLSYLPPLPPQGGVLPLWMGFVSFLAFFNTAQNLLSTKLTKQVYSRRPIEVTPLSARTFGVWTFLSAVLRAYTAYDITNKSLYDLSLISYVLVLLHFTSELFIFKTANLQRGLLAPLIVGSSSLIWMIRQRDHYLGL